MVTTPFLLLLIAIAVVNSNTAPCQTTRWINRDTPTEGDGDYETTDQLISEGLIPSTCSDPMWMRVQRKSDHAWFSQTGEVASVNNKTEGFVCLNADQDDGQCDDYRVRFCCPPGGDNIELPEFPTCTIPDQSDSIRVAVEFPKIDGGQISINYFLHMGMQTDTDFFYYSFNEYYTDTSGMTFYNYAQNNAGESSLANFFCSANDVGAAKDPEYETFSYAPGTGRIANFRICSLLSNTLPDLEGTFYVVSSTGDVLYTRTLDGQGARGNGNCLALGCIDENGGFQEANIPDGSMSHSGYVNNDICNDSDFSS